jgi:hypothetical protein
MLKLAIILALTIPASAMGPMLDAAGPYNMNCVSFNKTKGMAREKALAYVKESSPRSIRPDGVRAKMIR